MKVFSNQRVLKICRVWATLMLWTQLDGCGGVIVGNPHGGGSGKGTTGMIKLTVRDSMSRNFSKVLFNVRGVRLLGDQQELAFSLPSTKKVNAVYSGKAAAPDSVIELAVAPGAYRGLTLELDDGTPIEIVSSSGKNAKLSTKKSANAVKILDRFEVGANNTVSLNMFIDLDRSLKKEADYAEGGGTPGENDPYSYEFDPLGTFDDSGNVRSLSVSVIGGQADMVCVYLLNDATSIDHGEVNSGGFGTNVPVPASGIGSSTDPLIFDPAISYDKSALTEISADTNCERAYDVRYMKDQYFMFDSLPPRDFAIVARGPGVSSSVNTVSLWGTDIAGLIIELFDNASLNPPQSAALVPKADSRRK